MGKVLFQRLGELRMMNWGGLETIDTCFWSNSQYRWPIELEIHDSVHKSRIQAQVSHHLSAGFPFPMDPFAHQDPKCQVIILPSSESSLHKRTLDPEKPASSASLSTQFCLELATVFSN